MNMMTHYDILGVHATASVHEIRTAYRRLARDHHPDRHGGRTTPDMVRINEAWRVLSDIERRQRYDAEISSRARTSTSPGGDAESVATTYVPPIATPAKFPWRFVVAFFACATLVILLIGAFTEPGETPPIDNILRVGSCVEVNRPIQEAWEVTCDGPHEAQVVALVPFDGRCPVGTETFRDRQGLGLVCTQP